MKLLYQLWNSTLNSVPFGITLLGLVAIYIAIGSGVAAVREYFEMNELMFFSSPVLVVLMVLLVLNLLTVSLARIPFTLPRAGVWCVHIGIVTLIFGMFVYSSQKVEGLALIPVNGTAQRFYDSFERALFFRAGDRFAEPIRLPNLPRFHTYAFEADKPVSRQLDRESLRDLRPFFATANPQGGASIISTLGKELGLQQEPVFRVVGYYPYADVKTEFRESAQGEVGIQLSVVDPETKQEMTEWIVDNADGTGRTAIFDTLLEHRKAPDDSAVQQLFDRAGKVHRLDILCGTFADSLYVQPGNTYPVGDTGYKIEIEDFRPNFVTMAQEKVDLITFMVHPPNAPKFRRQVIMGRPNPTDWKLDEPDAGPMGKRQTKPLDETFRTSYTFSDPENLIGRDRAEKRTFITTPEGKLAQVVSSRFSAPEMGWVANGKGSFRVLQLPPRGPFQGPPTAEEIKAAGSIDIGFERRSNVQRVDRVVDIEKSKRDRDEGQSGVRQVVMIEITMGDWKRVVAVGFSQYAAEPFAQWQGPPILLPGASVPLRLQLGNTAHRMPAPVTLEKFELVPYPGGDTTGRGIMRDFKSHLRITDLQTSKVTTGVAHMNNPVYFNLARPLIWDESWLFFQAQWDPQGQKWTVLGVGNRPGVYTMILGTIMVFGGVAFAFWIKPIIIQKRKQQALQSAPKPAKAVREVVQV